MTTVPLACPADRAPLSGSEGAAHWSCPQCGNNYPVERGVVRFLEETDRFYEGRYLKTVRFIPRTESWLWAWPLWLINSGYVWAARKYIPAEATALEMGCASGFAYFAHRYRIIGLDLSFTSLAQVAPLYETCLQADVVRAIPLPDASVDAVLSSFVWEHILPGDKPAVLAECRRVLRPGGHLVFLYDVESRNPLYRLMKRRDENLAVHVRQGAPLGRGTAHAGRRGRSPPKEALVTALQRLRTRLRRDRRRGPARVVVPRAGHRLPEAVTPIAFRAANSPAARSGRRCGD